MRSSQHERWSQRIAIGYSFAGNWPGKQRIWGMDVCSPTSNARSNASMRHAWFSARREKWKGAPHLPSKHANDTSAINNRSDGSSILAGNGITQMRNGDNGADREEILWDAFVAPKSVLWSWVNQTKFIAWHLEEFTKRPKIGTMQARNYQNGSELINILVIYHINSLRNR